MEEKYKTILITVIVTVFITLFVSALIREEHLTTDKAYIEDLQSQIKGKDEIITNFEGYLDDINNKVELIYQYTVPDDSKVNDDFDFDH